MKKKERKQKKKILSLLFKFTVSSIFQNIYYQYSHLSLNVVHFVQINAYYFVKFQQLLYLMGLLDLVLEISIVNRKQLNLLLILASNPLYFFKK